MEEHVHYWHCGEAGRFVHAVCDCGEERDFDSTKEDTHKKTAGALTGAGAGLYGYSRFARGPQN